MVKKYIWQILTAEKPGDFKTRLFNFSIISLICLNVFAFILQTEPKYDAAYEDEFFYFELVSVIIFTIEYLVRLWACTEKYGRSITGRIKFIFSPMALIDLISILPFYLPFVGLDLRVFRALRMFRLFRMAKLGRYVSALKVMKKVVVKRKEELIMTTIIMMALLLFSSTIIYYAEKDVQPDHFGSIPKSLWWAVVTLTTIGYGDVIPATVMGKVITGIIAILGIGMFALPVGILGAGFVEEIQNHKSSKKCPHCGERILE